MLPVPDTDALQAFLQVRIVSMKHRAEKKRRFWPAVVAAVLIGVAGGGPAALVGGSGT